MPAVEHQHLPCLNHGVEIPFLSDTTTPITDDSPSDAVHEIQSAAAAVKSPFYSEVSLVKQPIPRSSQPKKDLVEHDRDGKYLPWAMSRDPARRDQETVRPIFWAFCPHSYQERTQHWDTYPNDQWQWPTSTASKKSFRDSHPSATPTPVGRRLLESTRDLQEVFVNFWQQDRNKDSVYLPWFKEATHSLSLSSSSSSQAPSSPLTILSAFESREQNLRLRETLLQLNRAGLLVIHYQPPLNGIKSTDPVFGWGPPPPPSTPSSPASSSTTLRRGYGYIYQKSYLEFFISCKQLAAVEQQIRSSPNLTYCTYHAINRTGDKHHTNAKPFVPRFPSSKTSSSPTQQDQQPSSHQVHLECQYRPNAVSWGVFPGREIIQPTVVEVSSWVEAWREEAFQVWDQWAEVYPEGSQARKILSAVGGCCREDRREEEEEEWFLMNIVNNDFHAPAVETLEGLLGWVVVGEEEEKKEKNEKEEEHPLKTVAATA